MISILLRGDYLGAFVYLLSTIFVIFLILPAHEFAHAFTAYKCGDYTARNQGRVTLNPFAHVDWFGAAMLIYATLKGIWRWCRWLDLWLI